MEEQSEKRKEKNSVICYSIEKNNKFNLEDDDENGYTVIVYNRGEKKPPYVLNTCWMSLS